MESISYFNINMARHSPLYRDSDDNKKLSRNIGDLLHCNRLLISNHARTDNENVTTLYASKKE